MQTSPPDPVPPSAGHGRGSGGGSADAVDGQRAEHDRRRVARRWLERLAALLLGLVVLLALLEGGLRLAHRVSVWGRDGARGSGLTVLCVGDSFTYGLGAPRELSYPAQLEALFGEPRGGGGVQVINRGTPGATLGDVRAELERALASDTFDVLVVLAGGTNILVPGGPGKEPRALAESPGGLRVARLLPMIGEDLQAERIGRAAPSSGLGAGFSTAVEQLSRPAGPHTSIEHCEPAALESCREAEDHLSAGSVSRALQDYERALERDSRCAGAHRGALTLAALGGDASSFEQSALRWLSEAPDSVLAHEVWLSYLIETGQRQAAMGFLSQHASTIPPGLDVHRYLAELSLRVGDLGTAEERFRELGGGDQPTCEGLWGLTRVALARSDRVSALRHLVDVHGACRDAHPLPSGAIGAACALGDGERAIQMFTDELSRDPEPWSGLLFDLAPCLEHDDLPSIRDQLLRAGRSEADVQAVLGGIGEGAQLRQAVASVNREELMTMRQLTRGAGASLVLVTYPYASPANATIRAVAQEQDTPLADTQRAFDALWAQGAERSDYFVGDGDDPILRNDHCSADGYAVVARTVHGALVEAGLVE